MVQLHCVTDFCQPNSFVRTFLDTDSREEEQGQSVPSGGWVCAADVLKKGDPCEIEFDEICPVVNERTPRL